MCQMSKNILAISVGVSVCRVIPICTWGILLGHPVFIDDKNVLYSSLKNSVTSLKLITIDRNKIRVNMKIERKRIKKGEILKS